MSESNSITILMAEDDADDRLLVTDAFRESRLANELRFVEDGKELMDYLQQRGKYADSGKAPFPGLLLLDLNMPKMDGREALKVMKADPRLRQLPVIVLTTSKAEEDILRTYDLGVAAFVTKPVTFESLVEVMKSLKRFWFDIVTLPSRGQN